MVEMKRCGSTIISLWFWCLSLTSADWPHVAGIDLIGQGYNIILANPDTVSLSQTYETWMRDPGLSGNSVFTLSYTHRRRDKSQMYLVPDQVSYSEMIGCDNRTHSLILDYESYQKVLMKQFSTGSFTSIVDEVFALGMGFNKTAEFAFSQYSRSCSSGLASYDFSDVESGRHVLNPTFVADICALTDETEAAYNEVIDKYGTHVIRSSTLGYREIERRRMHMRDFLQKLYNLPSALRDYKLELSNVVISIYSDAFESHVDTVFGSDGAMKWAVGSVSMPTAITYDLLRLTSLVNANSAHWKNTCANVDRKACCKALSGIRTKMDTALRRYAVHKGVRPGIGRTEFPVIWPVGNYGLPRPDIGCPQASDTVVWQIGLVAQYNGGWLRPSNNASSCNHFPVSSVQADLVKQHFCIKNTMDTSTTINIWQRGSYCIYKKNNCPEGFNTGSLLFDDDNDDNFHTGELPDGVYAAATTEINYCCRDDASPLAPLTLPSTEAFYLLRKGGTCQRVHNMAEHVESIKVSRPYLWPIETISLGSAPDTEIGSKFVEVFFCYYSPLSYNKMMMTVKAI